MIQGDCRKVLPTLPAESFDSVVTDPPYGLEFMGAEWDSFGTAPTGGASFSPDGMGKGFKALPSYTGSPNPMCENCGGSQRGNDRKGFKRCRCESPVFPNTRAKQMRGFGEWCGTWLPTVFRVLKPGGYMLAMGGTRTYHRLACAVEDAGFEIRDCLMWLYGTGFPKGQGCLKPAWEPVLLARKPGKRVLPLGIDECRVPYASADDEREAKDKNQHGDFGSGPMTNAVYGKFTKDRENYDPPGRYPANCLHDGSDEVLEAFAAFGERKSGIAVTRNGGGRIIGRIAYMGSKPHSGVPDSGYSDTGTAARFFYAAKASKAERGKDNAHPTVKPLALMRWLVRLVTPEGGKALDPFAGSGSTLVAATQEGREAVGIELDESHCDIARRRVADAMGTGLLAGVV